MIRAKIRHCLSDELSYQNRNPQDLPLSHLDINFFFIPELLQILKRKSDRTNNCEKEQS